MEELQSGNSSLRGVEECGGGRGRALALRWDVCMGCQLENPVLECGGVQRGRDKGTWDGDRRTWGGGTWRVAGRFCRAARQH